MNNEEKPIFKKQVECILFLESKPVEASKIARLTNLSNEDISKIIDELNESYVHNKQIFHIEQLEDSWQLTVDPLYKDPILEHYSTKKKRLTKALLETLSIVAYKQPVTKAEIDDIRGSNSAHHMKTLIEDQFIKISGKKKDAAGHPFVYVTTPKFLSHFNLKSLRELPTITEIKSYDFLSMDSFETENSKTEDEIR